MSPLALAASLAMLYLSVHSVYTWLLFLGQYRQQRRDNAKVKHVIHELQQSRGRQLDVLEQESQSSAWLATLSGILQSSRNREECQRLLVEQLKRQYSPLLRRMQLAKAIAPSMGLLFTVVGLIIVFRKQSMGLDHQLLLGDVSMALGTTAAASLVIIFQSALLSSADSLLEQTCHTGLTLVDAVLSRGRQQEQNPARMVRHGLA